MRHMVWTLALVGVLILPALSFALPRWQLDLVTIESASSSPLPASSSRLPASSSQLPASSSQLSAPSSQLPASGSQLPAPSSPLSASSAFVRTPASTRTLVSLPATLFGVWMIGALLILGRLVAGVLAVQWMSRRTELVLDAPWLAQAKSLAAELGISSRIVFLRSRGAAM